MTTVSEGSLLWAQRPPPPTLGHPQPRSGEGGRPCWGGWTDTAADSRLHLLSCVTFSHLPATIPGGSRKGRETRVTAARWLAQARTATKQRSGREPRSFLLSSRLTVCQSVSLLCAVKYLSRNRVSLIYFPTKMRTI